MSRNGQIFYQNAPVIVTAPTTSRVEKCEQNRAIIRTLACFTGSRTGPARSLTAIGGRLVTGLVGEGLRQSAGRASLHIHNYATQEATS